MDQGGGFSLRGQQALFEIEKAEDWGLDVTDFELPSAGDLPTSHEAAAMAELELNLAILKYARFARGGRWPTLERLRSVPVYGDATGSTDCWRSHRPASRLKPTRDLDRPHRSDAQVTHAPTLLPHTLPISAPSDSVGGLLCLAIGYGNSLPLQPAK